MNSKVPIVFPILVHVHFQDGQFVVLSVYYGIGTLKFGKVYLDLMFFCVVL